MSATDRFDAVIIGTGFAGVYAVHKLRSVGLKVRAFEAGTDVGGTWYWNRYPGARCDVESLDYQFAFSDQLQRGWTWSERYATQAEILDYLRYVADELDVRRDIQFSTRVETANFDEAAGDWQVTTDRGDTVTARFCVSAVGCLSAARVPDFPGLEEFAGTWYHTGQWPHEPVDFSGQRVGLVGTGSSGVQAIPVIAEQARHLTVFQRSPNYSVPARNMRFPDGKAEQYKEEFLQNREAAKQTDFGNSSWRSVPYSALDATPEAREAEYESRWREGGAGFMIAYADLMSNRKANDTAADFIRQKIADTVQDPVTAELLTPRDHPIGAKRICVDTDYFETFNRDNVSLVDVRTAPIERITSSGLRTADAEYEFDCLVFATGYDAMTGPLNAIDFRGRRGVSLKEAWSAGPRTFLGLAVHDFPNLFFVTGPGSPSVLSNMVLSIEQHVEFIAACIVAMDRQGYETIEASLEAQNDWVEHVNEAADETLFPQGNSWYVGANIPGKPRAFMPYVGGVRAYREKCEQVVADGYAGFELARPAAALASG